MYSNLFPRLKVIIKKVFEQFYENVYFFNPPSLISQKFNTRHKTVSLERKFTLLIKRDHLKLECIQRFFLEHRAYEPYFLGQFLTPLLLTYVCITLPLFITILKTFYTLHALLRCFELILFSRNS